MKNKLDEILREISKKTNTSQASLKNCCYRSILNDWICDNVGSYTECRNLGGRKKGNFKWFKSPNTTAQLLGEELGDQSEEDEKRRCRRKKLRCIDRQKPQQDEANRQYERCKDRVFNEYFDFDSDDGNVETAVICGYAKSVCACEMQLQKDNCVIDKSIWDCMNEDNDLGKKCKQKKSLTPEQKDCSEWQRSISSNEGCGIACSVCPREYREGLPCQLNLETHLPHKCTSMMLRYSLWHEAIEDKIDRSCKGIWKECEKCDCRNQFVRELWKTKNRFCRSVRSADQECQYVLSNYTDWCDQTHWFDDFNYEECKASAGCGDIVKETPDAVDNDDPNHETFKQNIVQNANP